MLLNYLHKLSNWLVRRGSSFMITRNDEPYLLRHFLFRSPFFNVFLHRFYQPDDGGPDGTEVHSHPWDNISIVLAGGYTELFDDNTSEVRGPGFIGYRQALVNHRIDTLEGESGDVYTIFVTFRRKRIWGFNSINFKPVTARSDSGMSGWFLPRNPDVDIRDESEILETEG